MEADGLLRRVSDDWWIGRLRGYHVHVFVCAGLWSAAIVHPLGHTEVLLAGTSLQDAALRARDWVAARTAGAPLAVPHAETPPADPGP
jgi:hypothetical protein